MIEIRRSQEHFHSSAGWLSSFHHFSFDQYYDPSNTHYGLVRVFNEDVIQPASGFPLHPHRDMEIVTYVLSGELMHEDSMGNKGLIHAGEVQRMSAGTGVLHAEFNASKTNPVHLLQMWVFPHEEDLTPSWEQKKFSNAEKTNQWCTLVSSHKKGNALTIHTDAELHVSILKKGHTLTYAPKPGRKQYFFVIDGKVKLNHMPLEQRDAARVSDEHELKVEALEHAHVLMWDTGTLEE